MTTDLGILSWYNLSFASALLLIPQLYIFSLQIPIPNNSPFYRLKPPYLIFKHDLGLCKLFLIPDTQIYSYTFINCPNMAVFGS